ncbi:MAG: hypothetical protein P4N41_11800 [Negativicutes bacterium]|nr:hypothetical protein [Negativicutes bacterium]
MKKLMLLVVALLVVSYSAAVSAQDSQHRWVDTNYHILADNAPFPPKFNVPPPPEPNKQPHPIPNEPPQPEPLNNLNQDCSGDKPDEAVSYQKAQNGA